ncbi:MAG: helicase C-terminal domain-containing protein [Fibrobacterota bacterium]
MPIVPESFVAIDLETTGLDPSREDIIEIAGVRFDKGVETAAFATLVATGKRLPPFITALTGIRQSDLAGATVLHEALTRFRAFAGELPLVAHNIGFDLKFLHAKFKDEKFPEFVNTNYDTLLFARLGLPGQPNYKLETLTQTFSLCPGGVSHRAESDARACGNLFILSLSNLENLPEKKRTALARILRAQDTPAGRLLRPLLPDAPMTAPARAQRRPEQAEPLAPTDTVRPVTVSDMDAVFGVSGVLSRALPGYEPRPGQRRYAELAARALSDNELLAVEAGTGTGKSLAYLVPAVLFAQRNGRRVLLSTRTKALQDQIYNKEIPFLRNALALDFRAVVLKGRANYVCLRKWNEVLNASGFLLRGWEADEVLPLVPWLEDTESGDISECLGFNEKENRILWARLSSDAETCRGPRCPHNNDCFVMRRRREALAAHVVLINHSLFFTDLKGGHSVLGSFAHIVFDEAHALEEVGRKHLGEEITHVVISTALQKLHKDDEGGHGLLRYLENRLLKAEVENAAEARVKVAALMEEIPAAEHTSVRFFRELGNTLRKRGRYERFRFKDALARALPLKAGRPDFSGLSARIRALTELCRDAAERDPEINAVLPDLAGCGHELQGLSDALVRVTEAGDPSQVFWAEGALNPINAKLIRVPLEIREILDRDFLPGVSAALFTSATLAVKGSLAYFQERLGLSLSQKGRFTGETVPSHFDFPRQLHFAALRSVSAPDGEAYAREVASVVEALSCALNRRMLVLFTSRDMLRTVHDLCAPGFAERQAPLLAQDIHGPAHALLQEMRQRPGAVLLGTDSFWEGIDLPGDHLEIVLIARLPFAVPTDPVVEARGEWCEQHGDSAFHGFYLPEAVIRFRQGTGRLIRRSDDRGAVVVLDRRFIDKPYGKVFAGSIGLAPAVYDSTEALVRGADAFFKQG